MKRLLDLLFRSKRTPTSPAADPLPVTTVFAHEMVVIQTHQTIDLVYPLLDITFDILDNIAAASHKFPIVVGDHGQLVQCSGGRRTHNSADVQRSSIYLEYLLDKTDRRKLRLRIIGNDPQSICVVLDERRDNHLPLIVFLKKPAPQEI